MTTALWIVVVLVALGLGFCAGWIYHALLVSAPYVEPGPDIMPEEAPVVAAVPAPSPPPVYAPPAPADTAVIRFMDEHERKIEQEMLINARSRRPTIMRAVGTSTLKYVCVRQAPDGAYIYRLLRF